ncbi:hypothetical protein HYALB_00012717 [Hymenoscyphus albidus]|uniref:Uncharacterized protein n=1 Tax=Hymenoscyphus albidus TaxID=595503 RepID=A0A9N9Q7B6_9HELO|nr:hypothetical protein HYALB_00012717 [Hymenoscyphus albidus]
MSHPQGFSRAESNESWTQYDSSNGRLWYHDTRVTGADKLRSIGASYQICGDGSKRMFSHLPLLERSQAYVALQHLHSVDSFDVFIWPVGVTLGNHTAWDADPFPFSGSQLFVGYRLLEHNGANVRYLGWILDPDNEDPASEQSEGEESDNKDLDTCIVFSDNM